jgi:hypothetical protein
MPCPADGQTKITDFGLAVKLPYKGATLDKICGTIEYAAPELVEIVCERGVCRGGVKPMEIVCAGERAGRGEGRERSSGWKLYVRGNAGGGGRLTGIMYGSVTFPNFWVSFSLSYLEVFCSDEGLVLRHHCAM